MFENVEKIIENVNATMRLAGMPLTTEDKEMLKRVLKVSQVLKLKDKKYIKK